MRGDTAETVRWVPVEEVGEVRMGKQLSPGSRAATEQFPYLRVANVLDGRIDYSDVNLMGFSAAERKTYALRPGDILLNEGQESLLMVGRSALYSGEPDIFYFQNTLIRFRSDSARVLPAYAQAVFSYWRRSGVFAKVAEKTSISHLGGKRFAKIPFPLISLGGQQRIIDILSAAESIERALEVEIAKIGVLRQSILMDLEQLPRTKMVEVLAAGPQNGLYKPAADYGIVGTPIVRISSFSGGPSDLSCGLLRVAVSPQERERYGLSIGDLIVNRVNTPELVGKSTIVSRLNECTVFESNLMRCRVKSDRVLPAFAEAWLSSHAAKSYLQSCAKSAISQASINRADVMGTPFPVLDLPGQELFLGRLDAIDQQMAAEKQSLCKLQATRQGLISDLLG